MVSQEKVSINSTVSEGKMYECHVCSTVSQIYCEPNFFMDSIELNMGAMHYEYMTVLHLQNGDTALHIAAALKRRKIAKILVESHVDTHLKNKVTASLFLNGAKECGLKDAFVHCACVSLIQSRRKSGLCLIHCRLGFMGRTKPDNSPSQVPTSASLHFFTSPE